MTIERKQTDKSRARKRADAIRDFRCKNLIVVIEDPENPRNIGTVIRNVNAFGAEKVYVIDPRGVLSDDWNELRTEPKLSKLSVSAVKWTFVKRFDSTEECLAHLEKNQFVSIVTSPHRKGMSNVSLDEGDFTEHAKLAVWFGSETKGISDIAAQRSRQCVSIPMFGMIESLNLGTSSGIVLYEITKQRRQYQSRNRLRTSRENLKNPTPVLIVEES
ncbi:TrmH family RNA methyltransferase [Gluconobacter sp.]|uniref:TrmH family RNA methyltransferase n=1 Tax=Gluconobacter sp. TaxID=1876758 RepID=UPI0039E89ECB